MKLRFVRDARDSLSSNSRDMELLPLSLGSQATHAFIASQQWERVEIELCEEIPLGSLKHIKKKVAIVQIQLPEQITQHVMLLLTELYPEISGKIRKQFLIGGDIRGLLPEMWEFKKES